MSEVKHKTLPDILLLEFKINEKIFFALLFLIIANPHSSFSLHKNFLKTTRDSLVQKNKSEIKLKDSLKVKKDSVLQKKKAVKKKIKPPVEESFMDKVQKIIEIRRSFEVADDITKPALMSFKKTEGEDAIFNIDIAVTYKGFHFEKSGFTPSVQFDYSSSAKDPKEKLKLGLDYFYRIYEYTGGSGKLRPYIVFGRDFKTKIDEFTFNLSFIPRFPRFFIPVLNVSEIKFKYDGKDNHWVIGLNPVFGSSYERIYGGTGKKRTDLKEYYTLLAANLTVKRYYLLFDVFGKYEKQFANTHNIRYVYTGSATFYFDSKERSSINAKFEQEERNKKVTAKITFGFGIKL